MPFEQKAVNSLGEPHNLVPTLSHISELFLVQVPSDSGLSLEGPVSAPCIDNSMTDSSLCEYVRGPNAHLQAQEFTGRTLRVLRDVIIAVMDTGQNQHREEALGETSQTSGSGFQHPFSGPPHDTPLSPLGIRWNVCQGISLGTWCCSHGQPLPSMYRNRGFAERKEETGLSTFNVLVRRLRGGEGPGKSSEAKCWRRAGRGCPLGAHQTLQERLGTQQEGHLRRSGGGMGPKHVKTRNPTSVGRRMDKGVVRAKRNTPQPSQGNNGTAAAEMKGSK